MAEPRRKVRPKNPVAALKEHAPWLPVTCDPADVAAIQAVYSGTANEHQQRRAIEFVIQISLNGNAHFFPGEDGRRETDYALGRAFVGNQIISFIKLRRSSNES